MADNLHDRAAIQDVISRYSIGCSKRDWSLVSGLFLPEGEWCAAGATITGRAALEQAMPAFLARMEYFVQMNSPAVIAVDGDRATAESTIREMGKFIDADRGFECLGWYVDELVRTAEGWQFARRTFTGAGTHYVELGAGPASIV